MHAYINMKIDPSSPALPIQYNYFVQSAIYAALPKDVASRIHDEGYSAGNRRFKMFSFSRIMGKFFIDRTAGTIKFPEGARLVISSPDMEFFLSLVNNLLTKNHVRIGDSILNINEVRFDEQKVESDVLIARTLSPVVAYSTLLKPEGGKYTCYYQPGEGDFNKLINANLRKKYEAFYGEQPPEGEVQARPLDRPRLHVMSYKGTVVKGYTCRLKLTGPRELLQMGLDAGIGGKGSQGYGCVEMVKARKKEEIMKE
ncbi:CRISPR-associated endoribonuclease Cas6 [Pelotomaculum terephthalicicum JT]|uniref:CRISPR-associated endoribonuclease Cas6 n=1 Tax=Pelotomaculum terephthalicicum TaxID=206393 RepID=UPI001F03D3AD|nr:CRISPR-associated endoribonuclease Cas6 [Pelotomaculum terephthalicicum]MCG9968974.1 CRISPR-associated endoribonuclease Cas6 [Pelotomaculum terephthalicicum JT]